MRIPQCQLILIALLCSFAQVSSLQSQRHMRIGHVDTLFVDLASTPPADTVRIAIRAGSYIVAIRNQVPAWHYGVSTEVVGISLSPLAIPARSLGGVTTTALGADSCAPLVRDRALLLAVRDERAVWASAQLLQSEVDAIERHEAACTVELADARGTLALTGQATRQPVEVKAGQRLVVIVTRTENPTKWVTIFSPGARGAWHTSYAFSFLRNRDRRYFAADTVIGSSTAVVNAFAIRPENRPSLELDFVPAIMFEWDRAKVATQDWSIGPTAGFGFDLKTPVVLGGVQFTYNQNVGASAGVAFAQRRQLRGEYHEGQVLNTTLTSDQLTTTGYGPTFFVSFNFRALTNPFQAKPGTGEPNP
jgi:hypothetical protein